MERTHKVITRLNRKLKSLGLEIDPQQERSNVRNIFVSRSGVPRSEDWDAVLGILDTSTDNNRRGVLCLNQPTMIRVRGPATISHRFARSTMTM